MDGIRAVGQLSPEQWVQRIQQQNQKSIVQRLLRSRKPRQILKPRDAVQSELYVEWEEESARRKRVKTVANIVNRAKIMREQWYQQEEEDKPRVMYSKSVQLPRLDRTSTEKKATDNKMNGLKFRDQSCQVQDRRIATEVKRGRSSEKAGTQVQRQEQIKISKQFHKNNIIKKLKIQRFTRCEQQCATETSHQDWQQVDCLRMQTYFVKMIRNKGNIVKADDSIIGLKESVSSLKHQFLPKTTQISEYIRNYTPLNPQINIEAMVKSQNFKVMLEDKQQLYFGTAQNGLKSGLGICVTSHSKIQGQWKDDHITQGYEITSQGHYRGKFKGNKRHGQGEFTWNNGETYDGEWSNGLRHGIGVWKSRKGDSYIGHWVLGRVEGTGVHITATGQKYQGQFKDFLKHGHGRQAFPNGDCYEGEYRAGKPNGKGKYTWKNGTMYEGEFVESYRHGRGQVIVQNQFRFVGEFVGQKVAGRGEVFFINGDHFAGSFDQGQGYGRGSLKQSKKKKAIAGRWSHNKFKQDPQANIQ